MEGPYLGNPSALEIEQACHEISIHGMSLRPKAQQRQESPSHRGENRVAETARPWLTTCHEHLQESASQMGFICAKSPSAHQRSRTRENANLDLESCKHGCLSVVYENRASTGRTSLFTTTPTMFNSRARSTPWCMTSRSGERF